MVRRLGPGGEALVLCQLVRLRGLAAFKAAGALEVWGLALHRTERRVPLLTHVARQAFANLTMPMLGKLWRLLKIPSPPTGRPKTERCLVEALVKSALPNLNDEELEGILSSRCKDKPPVVDTVLADPDNAEFVKDAFDEPDVEKLKGELAREASRSETARKQKRGPTTRGGGTASSSSPAPSEASGHQRPVQAEASGSAPTAPLVGAIHQELPRLPAPTGSANYTVAEVNRMLPQEPGCPATLESKWHSRWRLRYPSGFSTSKTFGGALSERCAV